MVLGVTDHFAENLTICNQTWVFAQLIFVTVPMEFLIRKGAVQILCMILLTMFVTGLKMCHMCQNGLIQKFRKIYLDYGNTS